MSEGNEGTKPSIKDFLKAKAGEISEKKKEEQRQEQVGKMEDFMVEVDEKKDNLDYFMAEVDEKKDEIGGLKEQKSTLTEQSLVLSESLSAIKEKVTDYKQKRDVLKKTFEESLKDEELVTYFKENEIESWRDLLDKAETKETDDFKKSREEVSSSIENKRSKEDEIKEKHGLDSGVKGKKLEDKLKEKEVVLDDKIDVLKMETPDGVQEKKEELTEKINQEMEKVYKHNYIEPDFEREGIDYANFRKDSFLSKTFTSSVVSGPDFDLLLKLNGKTETEMWSDFYKGKVEALVDKLYKKELTQKDIDYLEKQRNGSLQRDYQDELPYGFVPIPIERANFENLDIEKQKLEKRNCPAILNKEALDKVNEKLSEYKKDYLRVENLLKTSLETSLGKDIWEKSGELEDLGMLEYQQQYSNNTRNTNCSPRNVVDHLVKTDRYSKYYNNLERAITDTKEREKIRTLLSEIGEIKKSFYNFNLSSVFLPENDPLVLFVKKNGGISNAINTINKTERNKEEFKRTLTESVLARVSGEVARREEIKIKEENKDLLAKREEADKKKDTMQKYFNQIMRYDGQYDKGNKYDFDLDLVDDNFALNSVYISRFEGNTKEKEEGIAQINKEIEEVNKKRLPVFGLNKENQQKLSELSKKIDERKDAIKWNNERLEEIARLKNNALEVVNNFISELNLTKEELEKAKDQRPIEFLRGILNDRSKKYEPTEEESQILKKIKDLEYKRSKVFPN